MNDEIKIPKLYCAFYGTVCLLSVVIVVHFVCSIPVDIEQMQTSNNTSKGILEILSTCLIIVISGLMFKSTLTDFVSCVKLRGLTITMQENCLILSKKGQEYHINKTDGKALYCMMGWLLVWPCEKKYNILLLRKGILTLNNLRTLSSYLETNMDYIAADKEKKIFLKSLHINVYNPLKYIKWPVAGKPGTVADKNATNSENSQ